MQAIIQTALDNLITQKQQAINDYHAKQRPAVFFARYGRALRQTLSLLWQHQFADSSLCLLATGGFGRGEIYPYSDLDLAIVSEQTLTEDEQDAISHFIQTLWDIHLVPALKAGSIDELCESAAEDITGDTAFLEARFLAGNEALAERFLHKINLQRDTASFIEAKWVEMEQRHAKSQGSAAVLEPNIKTSPGGLRDIHTMFWIAKAQGLDTFLSLSSSDDILTHTEVTMLLDSYKQLAAIRINLHLAAGRQEDRLIFDLQSQVAENMGWQEGEQRIKSEKLMRVFYRASKTVTQLNGILLPMLRGRVYSLLRQFVGLIDDHYYQIDNQIAVYDKQLFTREPEHLFKILEVIQTHNDIDTIAPQTLRAWWAATFKIDQDFYNNPTNRQRFIGFFKHGEGLTHLMRFLNLYGVLERYLPAWKNIVGLLQHDLFHIYPVDDHILTVLRNARRLAMDAHSHELPFASALMHGFERQYIIYLATVFHDIAKGRGGNHAIEGIGDARRFAADHFLDKEESEMLCWLVEDHLLMSSVAQKEDIQNPDVISHFCERVKTQERLTALYLLTVADIRGTNPKLWNSWKAGLFETLFHAASHRLAGGKDNRHAMISRRQQAATDQLNHAGTPEKQQKQLWRMLGSAYIVRHELRDILWHTANLIHHTDQPQVRCRLLDSDGDALQVMVFMPNAPRLFARLCRIFNHHNMDILAARAFVTDHDYILDTFTVQMPPQHTPGDYLDIQSALEAEINNFVHGYDTTENHATLRPVPNSRRSRHLPIAPVIRLTSDQDNPDWYTLEIVAVDRPYLLADIAEIFSAQDISLRYAKISTLGERAEDGFVIFSTALANPKKQLALKQALFEQLTV
ncbi:[protein-PII] uridylyltransferase [Neisseria zalophi]|uniref:Bifunctional uridylyltransferase/uridylyl-removing enzyme n=1 Tax=Neisseria zalophi TaxID=640030 RepID=A0A5J6PUG9_9NEIS|nr:[protein-PII] uridylyltransferase [Neisseria zalophi]